MRFPFLVAVLAVAGCAAPEPASVPHTPEPAQAMTVQTLECSGEEPSLEWWFLQECTVWHDMHVYLLENPYLVHAFEATLTLEVASPGSATILLESTLDGVTWTPWSEYVATFDIGLMQSMDVDMSAEVQQPAIAVRARLDVFQGAILLVDSAIAVTGTIAQSTAPSGPAGCNTGFLHFDPDRPCRASRIHGYWIPALEAGAEVELWGGNAHWLRNPVAVGCSLDHASQILTIDQLIDLWISEDGRAWERVDSSFRTVDLDPVYLVTFKPPLKPNGTWAILVEQQGITESCPVAAHGITESGWRRLA